MSPQKMLAEEILTEVLRAEGVTREALVGRPPSDAVKVGVAIKVRERCPAYSSWLTERLRMGSPDYARQLMARFKGSGRSTGRV